MENKVDNPKPRASTSRAIESWRTRSTRLSRLLGLESNGKLGRQENRQWLVGLQSYGKLGRQSCSQGLVGL